MALPTDKNFKLEYARYHHYFHRLWIFYQKPVAKVSSALLLTLVTIIFFAAFAIRPTLVTVAELLRKIDDQRQVLANLKKKSAALASAQQEYMTLDPNLVKLNTAVPPDEELQALIKMIEATAAHHQLALNSMSVGDITYQPASVPQARGPQTRAISLSMTTDYVKLKEFLGDIIRIPRLVSVDSVSYSSPAAQDSAQTLHLSINLRAHFLPRDDTLVTP